MLKIHTLLSDETLHREDRRGLDSAVWHLREPERGRGFRAEDWQDLGTGKMLSVADRAGQRVSHMCLDQFAVLLRLV
jgi:hypothetical protein